MALYKPRGTPGQTVVIVPSIGDERRSLVRSEVEIAGMLAAGGHTAARFDFAGDGASPRLRSLDAVLDDLDTVMKLAGAPVTAVAFRAGACLLGMFLAAGRGPSEIRLCVVGPVTGGEFLRETRRRASLRSMLTSGTAGGNTDSDVLDLAGDVYDSAFRKALETPFAPSGLAGDILALEIGPRGTPGKDAASLVRAFTGGGLKPFQPASRVPGLIGPDGDGIMVWKHPVIWGEVEHSDVRPLKETVSAFIA